MNKAAFRTFGNTLEDLAHDAARTCRRAARALAAMPWPVMLAYCFALAVVLTLLLSILPLALFLFAVFMALKLLIVGFAIQTRRGRGDDYKL